MSRRQWLLSVAVGGAAVALGAGMAWWRTEADPVAAISTEPLFAAAFPDASGTAQPLQQWRNRVLVVNFWATWCAPCVEEMPDLQAARERFARQGVEIIGIGIDSAENIRRFRDKLGLKLPLLVAGLGGSELNRALGNDAGVLPYTVLIDREGKVRARHVGQIRRKQLDGWIERTLG